MRIGRCWSVVGVIAELGEAKMFIETGCTSGPGGGLKMSDRGK